MSILNDLINSNLPNDIINRILFYSNPRMESELQDQIKKFKFKKRGLLPFDDSQIDLHVVSYNFNFIRLLGGMQGFPVY